MFLFKLWIFDIDIATILTFLIGILVGAILICGLYLIFVLASLQDKKIFLKTNEEDISKDDIVQMIQDTKKAYKDPSLRQGSNRIGYCYFLCEGLVFGIATKYYKRSRHPLLEISIDEALELTLYVEKRLNEILDRRGIRLVKKMKVSTIVDLTTKTSNILDSKTFKVTKEVSGVVGAVKKVINAINPAWWFKKLVISNTMNIITDKICLIVISIVGEETYKIYSKKIFNESVEIESDVDNIIEEMNEDISKANNEINKAYNVNNSNENISFKKTYFKKNVNITNSYLISTLNYPFKNNKQLDSFNKYNIKYQASNI